MRTRVLFLCLGNACRSPMAEAIARHSAADVIDASSAGLIPLGEIMPLTIRALAERGISVEGQSSKALHTMPLAEIDLIINMTGRSGSLIFKRAKPPVEDWDVGDPYGAHISIYREIRDEIEARVEDLARRLREEGAAQRKSPRAERKEADCRGKKPASRVKIT